MLKKSAYFCGSIAAIISILQSAKFGTFDYNKVAFIKR